VVNAPTGEIGSVQALPGWNALAATTAEQNQPATEPLAWKGIRRVSTVDKMRVDSQVESLCLAVTMPVLRMEWTLNPNGARDEVVQQISTDLGIPIQGATGPAARSQRRFKHRDHMEHALLALWYGHIFFEQVPDTENFDLATDGWRLRKLAPRMPSSIQTIHIAKDGGLDGITQIGHHVTSQQRTGLSFGWNSKPQIPVTSLAGYVWKREGADWYGRSLLRPLYRDWLLKDRALRVDALKNERFGLGIPVGTAPPGGDPAQYAKLAQAARASEFGGVGVEHGGSVGVEGIRGTLPDVLGSVRYYDESMAKAFMAMVVQLGQTSTGSRALGETFSDYFKMLVEAVASWYADTTNEHVINDMVDWNWSEEEQAPLLQWAYAQGEESLTMTELTQLVDKGVITMDADTERAVRHRARLPPLPAKDDDALEVASSPFSNVGLPALVQVGILSPDDARQLLGVAGPAPTPAEIKAFVAAKRPDLERGEIRAALAAGGTSFAARKQTATSPTLGHRQPNAIEVRAATDFEVLQTNWQGATGDLVADWRTQVQAKQIDALVELVKEAVDAGDLVALSQLQAPVLGADLIQARMMDLAEDAIVGAKEEALAQGVKIGTVNIAETVEPLLAGRADATANLLSRGLADSASRQAINLAGLAAQEVADAVREHLVGLTDAYLQDMLGGAMTQAQNTGRKAVFKEEPSTIYSSELLDENTCPRCTSKDGEKFDDLADAEESYPTGGYRYCLGGPRCRGTLVAIYDEAEES
jgi:hypothetical protein